jgi:hypothetical protein
VALLSSVIPYSLDLEAVRNPDLRFIMFEAYNAAPRESDTNVTQVQGGEAPLRPGQLRLGFRF